MEDELFDELIRLYDPECTDVADIDGVDFDVWLRAWIVDQLAMQRAEIDLKVERLGRQDELGRELLAIMTHAGLLAGSDDLMTIEALRDEPDLLNQVDPDGKLDGIVEEMVDFEVRETRLRYPIDLPLDIEYDDDAYVEIFEASDDQLRAASRRLREVEAPKFRTAVSDALMTARAFEGIADGELPVPRRPE